MPLTHEIEFRVRYKETDGQGVVHHANYFVYFEMGRTEMLRSQGYDYSAVEAGGILMVVANITCKYRRPAKYDDVLTLRTTLERVTAVKIEHSYQLLRGTELLAEASSTLACVGRDGQMTRVPEWMRDPEHRD